MKHWMKLMWTTEIQILMKRSSLNFSLRKQPTFGDATTGFTAKLFKFALPQFTSFSFKKHFCKIFDVSERELFRYHRLRVCFTPPPFFPMVRPVIPKCSLCTDSPLGEGAFCEFFWGEGVLYTDYPKCLTSLYISCTIFAVATWKLFLQRHHLRRAFSHVLPSRDASSAMEDGGRGNCG